MTTYSETDAIGAGEVVGEKRFQLVQRMGYIGPKLSHSPFRAPTEPMPNLRCGVFGRHKHHEGVAGPMRQKQRDSSWLIETG